MSKTLYSKKYNLEFFHITKNGMTSIIHQLDFDWYEVSELDENRKTFEFLKI